MKSRDVTPRSRVKRIVLATVALSLTGAAALTLPRFFPTVYGSHTIDERLAQYGHAVRERLKPKFAAAGAVYPPQGLVLVGLKQERELRVYAPGDAGALRHVMTYPIRGASGVAGPKLREGDRQVPEGEYAIESLNPNSRFHSALRVGYPNAFDRARAAEDGRAALGGDIMIHGGSASVGCLAMGDEAAEDLFVLAAGCGVANVRLILVPRDLRTGDAPVNGLPPWTAGLYDELRRQLSELP